MTNKKIPFIVVGVIIALLLLWGVGSYNRFVSLNESIDGQWAQVEVQLQRRFDLIPNLVESVKGIFEQEKTIFTALAEARARYAGAASVNEKARAAGDVETALARLLVIVENYPQLRSVETVTNLMNELAGTENRISVERRRFNEDVRDYNIAIKRFPANMLASVFHFSERALFETTPGSEAVPQIKL